ncbi:MAG: cobyrinate a,c-diamide synthase [Actinobacteria bacterium]|nr:cobyrinate a,c-diamide synthase [Actinomycetota bacterium]
MVALPRLVIAAPATGAGKTTIATGLMAALRLAGHQVSGHKVGPDYIDPGYHALATGRPGRNLDPHLVGEARIVPLLLHGAAGADVAVIEGVMGLYDGRLGTGGFASTAHVARLTGSPVVLVLDVARMSRTVAAVAAGMAAFDDGITIAGVVLNRTGSPRNDAEIATAVESTGLPVLGMLPRDADLAVPSRHLGLVPAQERDGSIALLRRLGEQVARHLDLEGLLAIARAAPGLAGLAWDPCRQVRSGGPGRPVIAVAGGRAFTFRYAETEELLRAAGCAIVTFDPLSDPALPERTSGIYLGGGFPEVYAAELAANHSLLRHLRAAVEAGIPTVAECAGLLYLARTLDGADLAAIVPADARMSERLTLRYPLAQAATDSLLTRAGEQVTGHEFHRTRTEPVSGGAAEGVSGGGGAQAAAETALSPTAAWIIDDAPTGFATRTWHASYLHVHWAGYPQLAQRFANAAHRTEPYSGESGPAGPGGRQSWSAGPPSCPPRPYLAIGSAATGRPDAMRHSRRAIQRDPLRHHGDAETGPGLLDFAVNVFDGPRPAWLEAALQESLAQSSAYPDARPAAAAIAAHHGRRIEEVLPCAGAAEAFTLIARLRRWRRPVVVHPQFTEPHAALERAGRRVIPVLLSETSGFALDPDAVPADADLVILGNPTNPTGVLHSAEQISRLRRPGRLLVVDEAFMDAVPDQPESLIGDGFEEVIVLRSLTKHWSIPGVRAGYLVGDHRVIRALERQQTPWSVSTPAIAAMLACCTPTASAASRERAVELSRWRAVLEDGLRERRIAFVPSAAPFVLARPEPAVGMPVPRDPARSRDPRPADPGEPGSGRAAAGIPAVHSALRRQGIAVRRADTFPGLDSGWIRIAVRPPAATAALLAALDRSRAVAPIVQPQSP